MQGLTRTCGLALLAALALGAVWKRRATSAQADRRFEEGFPDQPLSLASTCRDNPSCGTGMYRWSRADGVETIARYGVDTLAGWERGLVAEVAEPAVQRMRIDAAGRVAQTKSLGYGLRPAVGPAGRIA